MRLKAVSYVEAPELVVWDELFVGSASGISKESSAEKSEMTCGKTSRANKTIMSCFYWLGTPLHTRMLDDNVDTNTDLCVRALYRTPTVFGSGVNGVTASGVDVGGAVRGHGINTCSVTLKKNRIREKHKKHERGLISYSLVT